MAPWGVAPLRLLQSFVIGQCGVPFVGLRVKWESIESILKAPTAMINGSAYTIARVAVSLWGRGTGGADAVQLRGRLFLEDVRDNHLASARTQGADAFSHPIGHTHEPHPYEVFPNTLLVLLDLVPILACLLCSKRCKRLVRRVRLLRTVQKALTNKAMTQLNPQLQVSVHEAVRGTALFWSVWQ